MKRVCVFCGSNPGVREDYRNSAQALARALAGRGLGLVYGGGNVGLMGAMVVGVAAGFACLWGVNGLKKMLGADDSLDVFGVHGVGGIVGALLTGVFNSPALGGPSFVDSWVTGELVKPENYSIASQVWVQLKAVVVTVLWSGLASLVAYKITDLVVGLRVAEEEEREGLDISAHGETAYHT